MKKIILKNIAGFFIVLFSFSLALPTLGSILEDKNIQNARVQGHSRQNITGVDALKIKILMLILILFLSQTLLKRHISKDIKDQLIKKLKKYLTNKFGIEFWGKLKKNKKIEQTKPLLSIDTLALLPKY